MVQGLNPTVRNVLRKSINVNRFFKYKLKPQPKPKGPIVKRIYRYQDRLFKVQQNKCDLCNDYLPACKDNIEAYIDMMNDINNSYESEYDRQEPKLLLCAFFVPRSIIFHPGWNLGVTLNNKIDIERVSSKAGCRRDHPILAYPKLNP